MSAGLFSLIPEGQIRDILDNLQVFTGLAIHLIDGNGQKLLSFGQIPGYCSVMKKKVFDQNTCSRFYAQAGQRAQALGEAYIFACHAHLNHIAFPLIHEGELLGSVILGPFLMDSPDSTLVSDLAERERLSPTLSLELYDELGGLAVLPPARVNQLKKLVDHLLSPILPGERELLLQTRQKMFQQARINETIQLYKGQQPDLSLTFFNRKEKELLAKLRTGNIQQVKALLNELIGHVLFSEGGKIETVRVRAIELTTLLSRVAIDGGANPDSIYRLNSQFLVRLFQEQAMEELCLLMQEVLESFMQAAFYDQDKGNPYIRKALRYMMDHYNEPLDLQQVAQHVQLSPSYFSTLFRQLVGVPFREYLCQIRIEESKQLLLSKEYSLADIAISMGFPDQSYYCKVFKRIVGVTPGKFRG